jgi:predicted nucleic-acid-binding protein
VALLAFDTNVIMRLLVRDDDEQCRRAEVAFRQAIASGGAGLASVVLVEVSWVLRVSYRFDRTTVAATLGRLLATDGVETEDLPTALTALAAFEAGSADFADYFILESVRRAGALPLVTFDERLSRSTGAELVP